MILDVEDSFIVGEDTFLKSDSPTESFGVVFEDDLNTGYFYAINRVNDSQIFDALHIYNVEDVIDKEKPCNIKIFWTNDGSIASLLINDYCHAIFDFNSRAGYCRNGFPECNSDWALISDRALTDDLINTLTAE
jgi:hypothetical protein